MDRYLQNSKFLSDNNGFSVTLTFHVNSFISQKENVHFDLYKNLDTDNIYDTHIHIATRKKVVKFSKSYKDFECR